MDGLEQPPRKKRRTTIDLSTDATPSPRHSLRVNKPTREPPPPVPAAKRPGENGRQFASQDSAPKLITPVKHPIQRVRLIVRRPPRQAAAAGILGLFPAQRDVVRHLQRPDFVPQPRGLFSREAKVKVISGIIRNTQDNARIGRGVLDGGHDLFCRWAGEDFAARCGREHAVAHVTTPCWLVAAAAA